MAYGIVPDVLDEFLQMGGATSRLSRKNFCTYVMEIFEAKYLRKPVITDVEKLYVFHEQKHGFSEMLGSLDCKNWSLFGCLDVFKRKYYRRDHGSYPFILLEDVTSQDLWI